jgi:hypothetical protein
VTALRLFVLGAWGGVLLAFALTVWSAFGALPGAALAAELVGGTLPRIDLVGFILAIVATLLGLRRDPTAPRARGFWLRALLPLAGAACHAVSMLWVSPAIHELRQAAGGSILGLAAGNPLLEEFGRLHLQSTSLYAASVGVVVLTALWDLLSAPRLRRISA